MPRKRLSTNEEAKAWHLCKAIREAKDVAAPDATCIDFGYLLACYNELVPESGRITARSSFGVLLSRVGLRTGLDSQRRTVLPLGERTEKFLLRWGEKRPPSAGANDPDQGSPVEAVAKAVAPVVGQVLTAMGDESPFAQPTPEASHVSRAAQAAVLGDLAEPARLDTIKALRALPEALDRAYDFSWASRRDVVNVIQQTATALASGYAGPDATLNILAGALVLNGG